MKYIVSRDDEASMFTFSAIEKDRGLSDFIERVGIHLGFCSGGVLVEVSDDHVEDFLHEFGSRSFNIEKVKGS
jgi:hypothetical protein